MGGHRDNPVAAPLLSANVSSAPGANRTRDPLLRRQVLYPLSYEGKARRTYPVSGGVKSAE